MNSKGRFLQRAFILLVSLGSSTAAVYGATRAVHRAIAPGKDVQRTSAGASVARARPIKSGRHLIAYVFLASDCGFSTERETERAIRQMRASLRASQESAFADVTVVGVAIDTDIRVGTEYLARLQKTGTVFDEVNVGGGWKNHLLMRYGFDAADGGGGFPQVVLVERTVDAEAFPRHVEVQDESKILTVMGRTKLIQWVDGHTPVDNARLTQRAM